VPANVIYWRFRNEIGIKAMDSQGMGVNRNDAFLVFFLIGFVIAARLLLHVPNVSPVAASALFAGMMLRSRLLALVVPLAAMLIVIFSPASMTGG
jgi:hypothetical protein